MKLKDGQIRTIGKDNLHYQFKYKVRTYRGRLDDIDVIAFMVAEPGRISKDYFDFQFVELSEDKIKTTSMFAGIDEYYHGKGIPEALILELQRLFPDKTIISSSNKHAILLGESRTGAGSAVWERLVRVQKAKYLSEIDVYILLN